MSFTTIDNLKGELSDLLLNQSQNFRDQFEKSCKAIATLIAPVLHLDQKETYLPSSVDWFLKRSNIYQFINNDLPGELISEDSIAFLRNNEGEPSYYIAPKPELKEETFEGDLDDAETYCRIALKDESIFIQYWFYYPFNGGLNLELFDQLNLFKKGFFAHEGDWENVCVEIKPIINDEGEIEKLTVSSLRLFAHGECRNFQDTYGTEYTLDQLTQLKIYSCWHSHASMINFGRYDNPELPKILDFLRGASTKIGIYDFVRPNGKAWNTKDHLVFISEHTSQTIHPWLKFNGNWGDEHEEMLKIFGLDTVPIISGGVSGPMFKSDWNNPATPDFEGLIRPWCLNPALIHFRKITSVEVSYYPRNGQSFRCSKNIDGWDTKEAGLLKFHIIPDTDPSNGHAYPMPMFAITEDRTGSDERWYSYITHDDPISVYSGNGEPAMEGLYIGTNTKSRDWSNASLYPKEPSASYTVIVYVA